MNSGATILDDRETAELLRDHPHLLAIADAVRATQGKRTRSAFRRTPLLVAAVVACATAGALIAFLVVPAASSPHATKGVGPARYPTTRVADAPASPVRLTRAMTDASNSFGAPLILPDTPVLKPSDAESTAFEQWCPSASPGAPAPLCQILVQFPSPFVSITYTPTALDSWGSRYPDALDQYRAEVSQAADPSEFQIVSLSGGPALIETGKAGNSIEFRLHTLSITIWAPDDNGIPTTVDAAALQALAQSIVDRAATTIG